MHLHTDADGLTTKEHRETMVLFQSDIAPVLRAEIPSRPFPGQAPPVDTQVGAQADGPTSITPAEAIGVNQTAAGRVEKL